MAILTAPTSLAPPTTIYQNYFYRTDINILRRRYATVLVIYSIKTANPVALADVVRLIYTATQ